MTCAAHLKAASSVLLTQILLISMLVLGGLPQGVMEVSDSDGVRIVICTGNGPLDLWQQLDGTVSEQMPEQEQSERSHDCINVLVANTGVQSLQDLVWGSVEFSRYRLPIASRQVAGLIYQTPQQPRAPPIFS
ncbi:hypothetical protein [Cohaesibacter gelatinilyticus]|uniref:Uncharacterized protein n=1 Tax=Cohaesibacter gelatinilyticus TaxID=372072 RepID=A0A285NDH7_9HYPH|nr:hypothetical protein [Cohaesibacter gelatinilyticus]SNZ07574.1 hypothetical protein SAMN06265368_1106 [Cohaesibacter gelatinilyticus]